ncbi:ATP-grasp domain-containing protein [Streptomyces sp. HSG2]|uniref:ATP-grasp domain-containing protein n=1 Tax=Streptomyces sp. HSG2 TaxID=2797167 RepID=UPI001A930D31|nr:ATP-grasp domain-containing protein [Streptomyces sp. HSG2]
MKDQPAVLVLGGGTRLPKALRAHGMYVVYGGTRDEFGPAHRDACDEALLLPDDTPGTWFRRAMLLHQEVPFQRVVTVRERFLTTAARIGDALGLVGNPLRTVLTLKDKALMRQHLDSRAETPSVRSRMVRSPDDLNDFIAQVGLPVVMKPRDGSGSEGVLILRDPADKVAAHRKVTRRPETFLVEEFLDGPEFSVESFTSHGAHRILAITEKFTGDNAVEIGHVVPARISADHHEELTAAVRAFLDEVGLTEGPAHTEIILTSRGPRVVESHNRPGGDGIVDLVRHARGIDVRDLLAAQIAGVSDGLPDDTAAAGAAATWFLTAAPGVVTRLTGWDEAARCPGVVEVSPDVRLGDTVAPLRGSSDRCGAVIAIGADPDEALDRAHHALSLVHVTTEPATTAEEEQEERR